MKTSLLFLFLLGAALTALATQKGVADDGTTSGQPAASGGPTGTGGTGTATGAQGQRGERLRHLFAELGLTDAQKEQIRQIRATVTDRRERREQIMNVLTPDQRAKLRELREEHRNGPQPGAGSGSTAAET